MRGIALAKGRQARQRSQAIAPRRGIRYGILAIALLGILGAGSYGAWQALSAPPAPTEAPEAGKVLAVQAGMPFQILIPAYMPGEFDRPGVTIDVSESGPGGEPMVQLIYRTASQATLFVKEWVPGNPSMEILANSKPIQTKWGKGWLLESLGLYVVWTDIGPLRAAVYSPDINVLTKEQLLGITENLGPASNRQVFNFLLEQPKVKDMPAPPPYRVPTNARGVQELTLVVTPGGYTPLRFSVKRGVPVKLTFRQLGQVGCGNELVFPANPESPTSLKLKSEQDQQVLEFTPEQTGQFEFHCSHLMYRGIMTVTD